MSSMILKSPAGIPAVVETALGFTPAQSLVVIGVGGGPSARVDISPANVGVVVEALAPAATHWGNGVIVALYSETVDALDVEAAMLTTLPGVRILAPIAVVAYDGTVFANGTVYAPEGRDSLPAEAQAKHVAQSRDALVAEADATTDAGEAWTMARASYLAGDGAKAWCYLDRFRTLGGDTMGADRLESLLSGAVRPTDDIADTLPA